LTHVTAHNSLVKTKLTITYVNDSETNIEAMLEMPSSPHVVIGKMKIKVGDRQEINGVVKNKEKAREQYEDAVASGYQAGLMEIKENDENVLQMRVGNIEKGEIIVVRISLLEQAQIFEGAYQITIPRGLMYLMTETKENSLIEVDIYTTSQISNIFCPSFFKKTDAGLVRSQK